MRYTAEQLKRTKAKTKVNHHKISMEAFCRLAYMRNNFPIHVHVEDGFYIVESKMNNYELQQKRTGRAFDPQRVETERKGKRQKTARISKKTK